MNTIQKLVTQYNKLDTIQGKEQELVVSKDLQDLSYQWLKEFSSENPNLLKFLGITEQFINTEMDVEYITKYINDSQSKVSEGMKKIKIKKIFSNDAIQQINKDLTRAILGLYIEVFKSEELSVSNRIIIGNAIKDTYHTIVDFDGDMDEMLKDTLEIIARRVKELESRDYSPALHYWPLSAPPFDDTMSKLAEGKFIQDISFAHDVFKRFDHEPLQRLRWLPKNRRLFIYFLLLLYGGREHNGEDVIEIGQKLFDFNHKGGLRKDFNTELLVMEKKIRSGERLSPRYVSIEYILRRR